MNVVILGLSITSSWGNGHATNFRALQRALVGRGHDVTFLERDVPWYAASRDMPEVPWGELVLYESLDDLTAKGSHLVSATDLVVVGSYVPEGIDVGRWVRATAAGVVAFYDIDTPVTMSAVRAGTCTYLDRDLMATFDVYLSFSGGANLTRLRDEFGVRRPVAFYCLVDPQVYTPSSRPLRWDFGHLGTYSEDRGPALERLLLEPARLRPDLRFVVAGPQYPKHWRWPPNVERIDHLPPGAHAAFYASQRATLNITRADMVAAGWSPSVRLFEAGACAVPVVSDRWPGIAEFFEPGREVLLADDATEVLTALDSLSPAARQAVGDAARRRVLAAHTAEHRAALLEHVVASAPTGARS